MDVVKPLEAIVIKPIFKNQRTVAEKHGAFIAVLNADIPG